MSGDKALDILNEYEWSASYSGHLTTRERPQSPLSAFTHSWKIRPHTNRWQYDWGFWLSRSCNYLV